MQRPPKERPEPAAAKLHDKHLARGRALMKKKKYQLAIHEFASALEAWPDEPQALLELGRSALLDGDVNDAESALKGALDAAEDDATRAAIHFALAQVADKRGNQAAALKAADESLRLHPDDEVKKWRAEHATSR
jgi:tetratricopeptide (TPR) repeat protein